MTTATGQGGSAATGEEGQMTTATGQGGSAATGEEGQMTTKTEKAAAETPEQIEARVRESVVAEAKQINAVCTLAGVPERAAAYLAEGKKLPEIVAALEADVAAGKIGKRDAEISARLPQGNGQGANEMETRLDPTAIYAKWNGRRASA